LAPQVLILVLQTIKTTMDFNKLIQELEQVHSYLQAKAVSAVNQSLTIRNWLFGYHIVEYEQNGKDRAKYGENLLKDISNKLKDKNVKGLSKRRLYYCCQFYKIYPGVSSLLTENFLSKEIVPSLTAQLEKISNDDENNGVSPSMLITRLSFTHIVELLGISSSLQRTFYEIQAIKGNWSVRELKRQKESLLYERTGMSTDKLGLIEDVNKKSETLTPAGIIRDPLVFEFVGLKPKEKFTENKLEEALLDHLQEFLLELGKGFCFEARQKRITIDDEYHNIDLVFYHRILKCNVLIDLKIRKFVHGDASQMNFYLNYYKDNETSEGDNPPIGIVLCTDKKSSTVKYATGSIDNQLFVSRYLLQLPSIEELERFIEQDKKYLGGI
jgi:predicted nuclease of restriction endonuclease-like (RecB) superfamily